MMLPEESNDRPLYRKRSIATALGVVAMLLLFFSCGRGKNDLGDAILERDSLPMMRSYGVTTFVSDSGRTTHKVIAEEWFVYDKKKPSYWAFEKGVYLEQYDTLFNVEATIEADTAYFFDKQELWELRSNVQIMNIKGERFETDLLFWDQKKELVYTDRFSRIEQLDRIIYTMGFTSDQQMIEFDATNVQGIFYIDDMEPAKPPGQQVPADSISTDSIN